MYLITRTEGCCALPTRYIVHNIDTGKWLFNASGAGEVGMAAWMEQPNHHPSVERWAAGDLRRREKNCREAAALAAADN